MLEGNSTSAGSPCYENVVNILPTQEVACPWLRGSSIQAFQYTLYHTRGCLSLVNGKLYSSLSMPSNIMNRLALSWNHYYKDTHVSALMWESTEGELYLVRR